MSQAASGGEAHHIVRSYGQELRRLRDLVSRMGGLVESQVALAAQDVPAILIWGSVISFFNLGAWGVVYTYTPEMYPTHLRGTGAGWAAACGRLFAFLAPLSIAWQIATFGGDVSGLVPKVVDDRLRERAAREKAT